MGIFTERIVSAAILVLFLHAPPAIGQTNMGEIGGVVRDSSGGVLPGAAITARHSASGTVVERVTDGRGRFYLAALRIGQWDITATLSGFAPQTQKGIVLEIGRTVGLEFTLEVGGFRVGKDVEGSRHVGARIAVGDLQPAEPRELRLAQ